ncbi:hypothetical protein BC833DRAFT_622758 [Globomyces pollinis-pini]|nr:hypothetical protein BC833DRAFT_622758 [Globomyces pollinis-pini]
MGGGLLAIFRASSAYSAHVRHKNDWVNHLVGGAASGLVFGATKGSMRHAALYSILSGTVGFLASGVFSQHFAMAGLSKEQRKERAPGFFAIPQPDPFAKRIEEMLARKQQ